MSKAQVSVCRYACNCMYEYMKRVYEYVYLCRIYVFVCTCIVWTLSLDMSNLNYAFSLFHDAT